MVKRERWVVVAVVAVTLVAMGRLCVMDFTWWDDQKTVHHNPLLNPPSLEGVVHYWTHAYMALYVPVTYTVWSGLAAIGRVEPDDLNVALNPWVFHTANVVVHVISTIAVYLILRVLIGRGWAAGVGAMVFGAHPVQVEAVGWVSGMKDVLGGMFVLLAVWQYLLFVRVRRRGHLWRAVVLTVLGTLSKPGAMVAPVVMGVLDVWVVGRSWRAVVRDVWMVGVAVVPCVIWAKVLQSPVALVGVGVRPFVAGDTLAFYLGKVVWPARLMVDYGREPRWVMESGVGWVTWVAPAGVGIAAWWWRRERPVLVGALLVFVGALLPVLGLTPFLYQAQSTVTDHYLYVPMLGVAVAVAYGMTLRRGRGVEIGAGVIIAVLAVRSAVQAGVWRDDRTLFTHLLALNPRSVSAHSHVAIDLEDRARSDPGNAAGLLAEAEGHLRVAAELAPDGFLPNHSLGMILVKEGKLEEAVGSLRRAVGVAGEGDDAELVGRTHYALGAVLWREGKREEAVGEFEEALKYSPGSREYAGAVEMARRAMRAATTRAGS